MLKTLPKTKQVTGNLVGVVPVGKDQEEHISDVLYENHLFHGNHHVITTKNYYYSSTKNYYYSSTLLLMSYLTNLYR